MWIGAQTAARDRQEAASAPRRANRVAPSRLGIDPMARLDEAGRPPWIELAESIDDVLSGVPVSRPHWLNQR